MFLKSSGFLQNSIVNLNSESHSDLDIYGIIFPPRNIKYYQFVKAVSSPGK